MLIEDPIPLLEEILGEWKTTVGKDYEAYKNHVYRMVHFCFALHPCTEEEREKVIVAGCFHDLGIWANDTFDYLQPSVLLAEAYLKRRALEQWSLEVGRMIHMHHKVTNYDDPDFPLVEVFRRADLVDVTLGKVKWGLPKDYIQSVKARFPNAGFHKRLLQLGGSWFLKHPLNPLPMMKR